MDRSRSSERGIWGRARWCAKFVMSLLLLVLSAGPVSLAWAAPVVGAPVAAAAGARPAALDAASWAALRAAVDEVAGKAVAQQAKLVASDGAGDDNFGTSVAVFGDTAVVGAPQDDIGANSNQGSAYVFIRTGSGWSLQAKLTAPDGAALDRFGSAVAIYGDLAVVGAPSDSIGASSAQGSAYVFQRSGAVWSSSAKLIASDGLANDRFGWALAMSEDTILVGAPYDDLVQAFEYDKGSVYVYTLSGAPPGTWTRTAKLVSTAAFPSAPAAHLGSSIAFSGDTALVGAPQDSIGSVANEQGSAFVFVRSGTTWSTQATLTASASSANANFGAAVALYGDSALIGAPRDDIGANILQGSAYFFVRNSAGAWAVQGAKRTAADGAVEDLFGSAVALSYDMALVGAPLADIGANLYQGAMYAYAHRGGDWFFSQKILASDGAQGDRFGVAIALYGNTALTGAFNDSIGANLFQGSAYLLQTGDMAAGDSFGYAVAVDADTAVVGIPSHDVYTNDSFGAVCVFTRIGNKWSQQALLVPSDSYSGQLGPALGSAVAISGDTVLAGAPNSDIYRGRAHVFVRSGAHWREQAILVASDRNQDDRFGTAVALSGDLALIGAPNDDGGAGLDQGSVYAYARTNATWAQQQKLLPSDAAAGDLFGGAIALSGTTAVVGASLHHVGASTDQGVAYAFERDGGGIWSQTQQLTGLGAVAGEHFGQAVALSVGSTTTALIGAIGSAYVFERAGLVWGQQARLSSTASGFGNAVALDADTALVGAPLSTVGASTAQGAAFEFRRSGSAWNPVRTWVATDGATDDRFGNALALGVGIALVGAYTDDIDAFANAGSAYVFALTGGAWAEDARLTAGSVRTNVILRDGFE